MFTVVALSLLSSLDPTALMRAGLAVQQDAGVTDVSGSGAATAPEPGPTGAAEGAAAAGPSTPATASEPSTTAAPAATQAPETKAPEAKTPEKAPEAKKPEAKKPEPKFEPYRGRIRYVWPFAKEYELLPGDVRIPLPVWLMAVSGGVAVAAGIPFYTIARATETKLTSGDDSIRTDAQRAETVAFGRTMEAWGITLWATGGALVAASWTAFYVLGIQEKPKGLNYSFAVGPQGGYVRLELALP